MFASFKRFEKCEGVTNISLSSIFLTLSFIMIFFSSVTFSVVEAEIFPYGILFSLLFFRVNVRVLLFTLLLILSSMYGVYHYEYVSNEIIRSLMAYLNPLLVFFTIIKISKYRIISFSRHLFRIYFFLIILAIFQLTGLLNLLGLDKVVTFLIPRGSLESFGNGRGVSLLTSEPSRASMEFLFLSLFIRMFVNKSYSFIFDVFTLVFLTVFFKSATGLMLFFVFFFVTYPIFIIGGIFLLPFVFIGIDYIHNNFNIRAVNVIYDVLKMFANFNSSTFNVLFTYFLNSSGFRFISVYASYLHGVENFFGSGVGYWTRSSVEALNSSGIPADSINYFRDRSGGVYTPVRTTSYAGSIMLDCGLIGFLTLFFILKKYLITFIFNKSIRGAAFLFVFYLFILGTIGNPVPWLCMAFIYRKIMYDKSAGTALND